MHKDRDVVILLGELCTILGISKPVTTSRSALVSLMYDDLPAARELIMEYIETVADSSVQTFVANTSEVQLGPPQTQRDRKQQAAMLLQEDTSFCSVQEALEGLVSKGPSAWQVLLANWSIDLVAKLSDKYTKRRMPIGVACNYWMCSSTMRGLLTIVSICWRNMTTNEVQNCIENMLVCFQRFPLTFDWVIARLGGCFPNKILMLLLQCSLKRFSDDMRSRFDSEVGILEYLSFAHEQDLRATMREILQEGIDPKKPLDVAIIPFLLAICNYTDVLLQNLATVFMEMYNENVEKAIVMKTPLWMSNKIFADMQPSLNNVALRLKSKGSKLLLAVAKMTEKYAWCQDFLEFSLQELEQVVLNARSCPLINDLTTEESKYELWKGCLSNNIYEQQTAVRLLLVVSTQHSHIYYQTLSELLRKSYILNQNGLGAIIRMMGGQCGVVEFPDIKPGLQMVLEDILLHEQFRRSRLSKTGDGENEPINTFINLNTLTKIQKKNFVTQMKPLILSIALNDCLSKILQILEVILTKLLLSIDKDADDDINTQIYGESRAKKMIKMSEGISIKEEPMDVDEKNTGDTFSGNCSDEDENISEKQQNFKRLQLAHAIVDLLNTIEAGSKLNVVRTPEMLKLSILSVKYFFVCLASKNLAERSAGVNRACVLLQRQCIARKAARTACLRELVEGALFYYGYLFGQQEECDVDFMEIPENEMVLQQNQSQNVGPNSNRIVLHAGVIGRGPRPITINPKDNCAADMQALLLNALDACCVDEDKNNLEGYYTISLLLVEMVSTDVMYNGLPFPDDEFTKVTMERDLLIRRAFVTSTVLWALLGFIAAHRPALCFSSVLLRALCATCLHQWRAKNVNKFQSVNQHEELMDCTKKMLKIFALGQLLPPPLSSLHIIIDQFEATEIALILKECVWNYLKDHVPSPALFQVDKNGVYWRNPTLCSVPPQYVDALRNLMQKKLTRLGEHYHQMFILPELLVETPSSPPPEETKPTLAIV